MRVRSKIKTAPAQRVIALQALKDFLRIDTTVDDALLGTILIAAERKLEQETELKFVTQTWNIWYDHFPYGEMRKEQWWDGLKDTAITELYDRSKGEIVLPFGPLQSVTSVKYYLDDDTEQTFSSGSYVVDTISDRGRIALRIGSVWPPSVLRTLNAVNIEGVFGLGLGFNHDSLNAPSQIPSEIQEAVKHMCAYMYEHRGDELPEIPPNVMMLLKNFVRYRV